MEEKRKLWLDSPNHPESPKGSPSSLPSSWHCKKKTLKNVLRGISLEGSSSLPKNRKQVVEEERKRRYANKKGNALGSEDASMAFQGVNTEEQ